MSSVRFRREVIRWGNGFGIRLTKAEAARLRAKERTVVEVEVTTEQPKFNALRWRIERWGRDVGRRHTDLAAEAVDADR